MTFAVVATAHRVFLARRLCRAVFLAVLVIFASCNKGRGSASLGSGGVAGDPVAHGTEDEHDASHHEAAAPGLKAPNSPPTGAEVRDSHSNFGPGRFNSRFKKSRAFVQVSKVVDSRSSRLSNVWISANLVKAMHSTHPGIPDGTVAIKEFDTVEGKRLGVMVKMGKGYDPPGHDWYYEVRDQSGELLQDPPSGKIAACKACHERQQGNGGLKSMSLSH